MPNKRQFQRALGLDSSTDGFNVSELQGRAAIINYYLNKYFNLYMSSYEVTGNCLTKQSRYYLLKKLYFNGTIAAWRIPHTDLIGFAPYSVQSWDMYDSPATISLINERNVSNLVIPDKPLIVDRDAVIGWYQRNHQPLYRVVRQYAEQLADVQMVINTNLQLHKMPWVVITDDEETAKRIKDCVRRIVNNDLAVYLNAADKNALSSLNTVTPYIIDKLYQYKVELENELKTYLGLDNSGNFEKKERMLVDEVNSQRATIDDSADNFTDELDELSDSIKQILQLDVRFKARQKQLADPVSDVPHKKDGGDDDVLYR